MAIATVTQPWNVRLIAMLNRWEDDLDKTILNNIVQDTLDQLGLALQKEFAPLKDWNVWLDSNEGPNWYSQIAIFILKLPVRAVRNIIVSLYTLISTIIYAAVHPLKATLLIAQLLVNMIYALTLPLTWTKIGAGMVGGSLAHALLTLNLTALIAAAIGGVIMIAGISAGVIQAAVKANSGKRLKAAGAELLTHFSAVPEALLTGFLMGLLVGGIFKAITYRGPVANAEQYVKQNHLSKPSSIITNADGSTTIQWKEWDFFEMQDKFPQQLDQYSWPYFDKEALSITIKNGQVSALITFEEWEYYGWYDYDCINHTNPLSLADFNLPTLFPEWQSGALGQAIPAIAAAPAALASLPTEKEDSTATATSHSKSSSDSVRSWVSMVPAVIGDS